ncbi:MAG: putative signal transduction histidine kinase [Bacteroidetes bacterium]|nr:putative signal transduction histidine kinase [Bacteroidota bacterium]
MKSIWLVISLFLFAPFILNGQFSNAIHYTVKDGLPSSTVYAIEQDSRGFMWIGTEAGLVRFDGANFKTYNTQDGLPDNEVLGLMFDGRTHRLWVLTYSKAPCYYLDDRIYNVKNDSSLLAISCVQGEFIRGNKQSDNGVFLYNGANIFKCAQGTIEKMSIGLRDINQVMQWSDSCVDVALNSTFVTFVNGKAIKNEVLSLDSMTYGGKWIGNSLFIYRIGKIDVYKRGTNGRYKAFNSIILNVNRNFTNVLSLGDKYFFSVEGMGVYTIDTAFGTSVRKVWSGRVNGISADKEGNVWIGTNDDGIYVIKYKEVRSFSSGNGLLHDNITAVYAEKNGAVYLGNSYGEVFTLRNDSIKTLLADHSQVSEMIRAITSYDDELFLLVNNMIVYFKPGSKNIKIIPHKSGGPKSLLKVKDGKTIIVGLLSSIVEYKVQSEKYNEAPTGKRLIAIAQHPDGRVFCASIDGIYLYTNGGRLIHQEISDPRLMGRITSMCFTDEGLLWIGTPSSGILIYDGKKVLGHITTTSDLGYHGAMCRRVVTGRKNEIWVATNSGVNKIRYHLADSLYIDNITPLNVTDGLLSDDVNDIAVNDSLVFVATSRGLTVMNENHMMATARVPIYISSIRINDKDSLIHDYVYELNYTQNNVKIEYVGVLLPAAGYLRYEYRLLGAGNDKWVTTANTSIEFRSLSPGSYIFEAVVLDKFGKHSQSIARVQFRITPAYYMTVWFWALMVVIVLTVGFYIIRARFRRQQRQFEKEQNLNNKIIELEQQALKAQMNPHFIFNCLTAVQHFVNKEDLYSANMYLSNFAKLIRKTLDLSGEQYISLDKEVSYLDNYIQMEKMRFQEKFQYTIKVAEDVDQYAVEVPPMLMQPIIENAIRHGLRNLETDTGMLAISFTMDNTRLVCNIEDNGIGRKKAGEIKTAMHMEYQSKGLSLTLSRINAINMISPNKISIQVRDKYNSQEEATGTLVTLTFEQ